MRCHFFYISIVLTCLLACKEPNTKEKLSENLEGKTMLNDTLPFPNELVNFKPISENPLFSGTGENTWDKNIRERGYILKEGNIYHMWYTGFQNETTGLSLGYASSSDGLLWKRYAKNPIFNKHWTEDIMVINVDGIYHMFAEGKGDIAHRLSSDDRVNWTDHGSLDIRKTDGSPLTVGPYGTPTVWFEKNTWYLLYERNDQGIWLATSTDLKLWTNVQDEPVIEMGPEVYDQFGLAVNQIIKYEDWYYAYYHGTSFEDWREWSTNVAASKDLIHWQKYDQNPILGDNLSSGILVEEGDHFRMYTMHHTVRLHLPKTSASNSE